MKRIFILFLSAVISFLFFSYIDEYETLVRQFLKPKTSGFEGLLSDEELNSNVKKFLDGFNSALSEVYLAGDERKLSDLPVSEELRRAFKEDISFLKRRGKILEIIFDRVKVVKVNRMSFVVTRVEAREEARIAYRLTNAPDDTLTYSKLKYGVAYTLIAGTEGLMVADIEITVPDDS